MFNKGSFAFLYLGIFFFGVSQKTYAEETKKTPLNIDVMPLGGGSAKAPEDKDVLEQKGLGAPVFPNEENLDIDTNKKPDLKKLCLQYEGKLISYSAQTYYVKECKKRQVESSDVINELVQHFSLAVLDVSALVYRTIPLGKKLGENAVNELQGNNKEQLVVENVCKQYNDKYVTVDGESFFFIDKCTKRLLPSYDSLIDSSNIRKTIVGITYPELDLIHLGSDVKPRGDSEASILFKLDGDVIWSRLYRGVQNDEVHDSVEGLEKIEEKNSKPLLRSKLCTDLEAQTVSFFSKIYLIDKCTKRLITSLSLENQQSIMMGKGIVDLTSDQYRTIPNGKDIDDKALTEFLKASK